MAKKVSKRKQEKQLTKKQIARSIREKQQRKRLLIGLTIVGFLILLVIAYAVVNEMVLKPSEPVAKVNGEKIPLKEYQKYVLYTYDQSSQRLQQYQAFQAQYDPDGKMGLFRSQIEQLQAMLQNPEQLGSTVLDQMIDDTLVEQAARERNISVSPEEIESRIHQMFGYDPNAPTPTPTPITATKVISGTPVPTPVPPMTREQFEKNYQEFIQRISTKDDMSEDDFRDIVRKQILKEKLQEKIGEEKVPPTAEEVHARHILISFSTSTKDGVPTGRSPELALARAISITQQLQKGADFAELAKKYSDDPGSKEEGGDLGWFPRGVMVREFEDAAFSLKPGEISDPIKTQYGFHIIQVLEKDPNHELDESTLESLRQKAYQEWFTDYKAKAKIERFWSADKMPELPTATP